MVFGSDLFEDIFRSGFATSSSTSARTNVKFNGGNKGRNRRQRNRNFDDFFDESPPSFFTFEEEFDDFPDFGGFGGFNDFGRGIFQQMLSQQSRNFSSFNRGPVHVQSSVTCYTNGVGTTRVSKSVRDVNGEFP